MSVKQESGIYCIFNIVNNKVYIGSSSNLYRRCKQHLSELKNNKHPNKHLQRAFLKYGKENFSFNVIEYVDLDFLIISEQFWIDEFTAYDSKYGYNNRRKAESNLGFHHSEKTKQLISLHGGKSQLGKHRSEETKRKLSLANKGKKLSKETKIKIGEASKNRVFTEETTLKKRGENSPLAKLTEDIILKIKSRMLEEKNLSKIAKEFNISRTQIGRIKTGECWGWVKLENEVDSCA